MILAAIARRHWKQLKLQFGNSIRSCRMRGLLHRRQLPSLGLVSSGASVMPQHTAFNRLEALKNAASIVQSMVTVLALGVGAYWSYHHFHLERHDHPRLTIQHHISHRILPNGIRLLSVDEIYSNPSPVLLD